MIHQHTAHDRTPFTYVIGWSKLNRWYYGVRYAKGCHPNQLGKSYFSSSKNVKLVIAEHGKPDVIQIRKIFNSIENARDWETRVLVRLNVLNVEKWLNETTNKSICPKAASKHSKGRTYEEIYGAEKAAELKLSRSRTNSGRKFSDETKIKIGKSRKGIVLSDEKKASIRDAMNTIDIKIKIAQGKNKHYCEIKYCNCMTCKKEIILSSKVRILQCAACKAQEIPYIGIKPPKPRKALKTVTRSDNTTVILSIQQICDQFSINKSQIKYIQDISGGTELTAKRYGIIKIEHHSYYYE